MTKTSTTYKKKKKITQEDSVISDVPTLEKTVVQNVYTIKLAGFHPHQKIEKTSNWDGSFRIPVEKNRTLAVKLVIAAQADKNGVASLYVQPAFLDNSAQAIIVKAVKNGVLTII